ncbi:MAG: hypothetical protein VW258_16130, partial [Thalassolituus sp.]
MALGRAYGVYDYGEGVYGEDFIIDAVVAIAATSGATATPTHVEAVSTEIAASSGATATPTHVEAIEAEVITASTTAAA